MTQHYTREAGYDGGIYTGSGDAPGVNLSDLLDRGLPPLRAALEIGAAIADIISISEEDGTSHGDIKPSFVVISEDGSVSVEGYGSERKRTRAPESSPQGIPTDIYGLGVVMHALLSNNPLGSLSKDADAHDSSVVEKVQAIDLHAVADKPWSSELRLYLATILAFDKTERPEAVDIANVMGNASDDTPGEDLAGWAKRTVTAAGGGKSASKLRQGQAEDLSGPMSGIDESISPAIVVPTTNDAQSTAAWSKDRIADLVAQQDEETVGQLPEIEPETMEGPEIEQMDSPVVEEMAAPVAEEMAAPVVEEMAAPVVEESGGPSGAAVEEKQAPQTIQGPQTVISTNRIQASSFDLEPAQTARISKKSPKTVVAGTAPSTPTISGPAISGKLPPPPPPRGPQKSNKKLWIGVAVIVVAAAVGSQFMSGGDGSTAGSSEEAEALTNTTHELIKSGRYHIYLDAPDTITPVDNMGVAWQLRADSAFAIQVTPNDDRPMSLHRSNQEGLNVDEIEFVVDEEDAILTRQVSYGETSYQLYVTTTLQTDSGAIEVLCESLGSNSREKYNLDQMNVMLESCRSIRTGSGDAPSTGAEPNQLQGQDEENYDSGIIVDDAPAELQQDIVEEPPQVEQAPVAQPAQVRDPSPPPVTNRPVQEPVERPRQRPIATPAPAPVEPVVVETPAPAALAPPPYHATITVVGGSANLRCGDGQSPVISGNQTVTFSTQQSCAVLIGDAMGALTVDHTGSWTCSLSGGYVICSE